MAYLVVQKTAAQFTADNQVLLPNQIGVETDTLITKVGDGLTAWNSLYYDTPVKGAFEQTLSALTYRVPSSYAVTQAIAAASAATTLSAVLTAGNSATGQNIINLQQIYSTVATKTTRLYLDSTNANLMYMSGVYGNVNWLVQGTYSGTTPTISISCYDLVHASPYATGMAISRDSILISGSLTGTFPGAQYGADYSANYTSRSLIDQGYAAATFAPISVTNALTATYVGFGSGANVLTGSANLVWNGTTLSVGGYDSMSINGVAIVSMVAIHSDTLSAYESHTHSNTAAAAATFYGARSRGTSAAPSVVQNGDYLSYHAAVGYDGTDYAIGGYYAFIVDDAPGNNDMPTKWVLALSPNGTQVPVAALTVASTGATTFASTVSSTGYQISGAATSGTILRGNGTSYVATTATYPTTTTANQILFSTAANTIGGSTTFLTDGTYLIVGGTAAISGEIMSVQKNQNALTSFVISNTTSGTAAQAFFYASSSAAQSYVIATSATFTTSGINTQNSSVFLGKNGTQMNVGTETNIPVTFWSNNTERARLLSTGQLIWGGTALISVEKIGVQSNANAPTYIRVSNSTSGTGAYCGYIASDNTSNLLLVHLNTSYTTSGIYVANTGNLSTSATAGMNIGTTSNTQLSFWTNNTKKVEISAVGNVSIGGTAVRATTVGTNAMQIFNGTAPVGTLTNGCSFYSTAGEMRVMDAAGNATLLSPHEKGTNYWIYDSVDTTTGKRLKIDMEQFMKWLNKKFKTDFVHEYLTQ